jgi:RNA polymerase sigma-70 factor, ECF subfamily
MTDKPDSHREGTDEALMVRYQRGDRNALALIVRRYARVVYATAYCITGTAHQAGDLSQRAFLSVVEHAGNFHIEMHFRSWLFGLMHERLMQSINTSLVPPSAANEAISTAGADDTDPDGSQPPHKPTRSQLLSRRISECTASLPLLEREALAMKLTAQLTLTELAVATNTDGESVRTRLRYALDRLRESVSDTEDYARALR